MHGLQASKRVTGQAAVLNDLLQAHQPGCGLVQSAPGSGVVKLQVKRSSRLAHYLTEMCAKQGEHSNSNIPVVEIREMLKVRSHLLNLSCY